MAPALSTARSLPRSFIFPLILLVALSASGCCHLNRLTSYGDPDFSSPHYSSLIVYAPLDNLEWRQLFEKDISQALTKRGVTARQGAAIIPPTREWTKEKIADALKGSKAAAYLQISIIDVSVHEQYIPPKTETTVSQEITEKKGGKGKDTSNVATTSTTGGYVEHSTTTSIRLELIDIPSGKRAWIATTTLPIDFAHCSRELGEYVAEQLADDGMIR